MFKGQLCRVDQKNIEYIQHGSSRYPLLFLVHVHQSYWCCSRWRVPVMWRSHDRSELKRRKTWQYWQPVLRCRLDLVLHCCFCSELHVNHHLLKHLVLSEFSVAVVLQRLIRWLALLSCPSRNWLMSVQHWNWKDRHHYHYRQFGESVRERCQGSSVTSMDVWHFLCVTLGSHYVETSTFCWDEKRELRSFSDSARFSWLLVLESSTLWARILGGDNAKHAQTCPNMIKHDQTWPNIGYGVLTNFSKRETCRDWFSYYLFDIQKGNVLAAQKYWNTRTIRALCN